MSAAHVAVHAETGAIAVSWDETGWIVVCPAQCWGGRTTARKAVDGEVEFTSGAWVSAGSPYTGLPRPTRWERNRKDARGPIWEVADPHASRRMSVRCVDDEDGVVFIEGAEFSFYGDWHAISSDGARAFALALMAAAERAEGRDVWEETS